MVGSHFLRGWTGITLSVCLYISVCLFILICKVLTSVEVTETITYKQHTLYSIQYLSTFFYLLPWHACDTIFHPLPNLTLYCYLITSVSPIFVLCVSGYIQLYILHLCRYTCFHTVCQKVIYTVLSFVDISLFCFLFVLFVFYRQSIL